MPTSPNCINTSEIRFPRALFLFILAAGLAGNYFKFQIFLNIDFIFGSIFAMLALQLFGLKRGVIAAAIISGYTYQLWNHPYAIIIMTAEAAAVGWLTTRRRIGFVAADTLFWLFIGMPLVYLFYHIVMHTPTSSTMIVMAKQSVNAISNALVARLLFTAYIVRSKTLQIGIAEAISNLLSFFVLVPALLILFISSRTDFEEIDANIRISLLQHNQHMAKSVEHWIEERKQTIATLARIASSLTPTEMQSRLEQANESDRNFMMVGLLDRNAITIAYSPLIDELGNSTIGRSYADRSYIPLLKKSMSPLLSEVIIGKVGTPKPRVLMLAPVITGGKYDGYVAGAFNFDQIQKMLGSYSGSQEMQFSLLDNNGNVIVTNRTDQKVMFPFSRWQGTLHSLDDRISKWEPTETDNVSVMERWEKSFYSVESHIGQYAEWKLILEQSMAPYQKILYDRYSHRLMLLFVILLATQATAEYAGQRVTKKMLQFCRLTNDLPKKLASSEQIYWEKSNIIETGNIIENFKEMADTVSQYVLKLHLMNEQLEQRVNERTEDLQKSRDEWIRTFNSIPDIIMVLDTNCRIVHSNQATCTTLGKTADEIIGKSCHSLMHGLKQQPENCPHRMLTIKSSQQETEIFEPLLNRHFHITVTPLIDDGHFSGSIHVAHDITARKLAEESMRASEMRWKFALEGAGDGVWDWNKQADKVFFSHQWKTMLGYTDDEIGNSVSEWDSRIHPEDRHACYSELEKHFRGESEIYQSEHRILCKDGCYKWILDRGKVVERDIHGQPLRVIGTHTDISYRKEAEESILRAKDAADAANQSKSRFISVIAHEFHTPLGLLAISVDILDRYWDRLSEEERAAQHGQIRSAASQMSQLIDSVLAFNRQEAGGANAAPKFHDISRLCRTIAEEVETVWSDNHLFHISISSECGTYQLDEALFRRILVNLLTNAFRFTPSGRSVTFIANRKEDRLIIEVRDAGIGIPQGDQERIFQAFYRCSNVESRPGLGLGLSILNESLKKMNGDISITSSVGEGTTFRVEIPLNDESRENRHEFNTYN